MIVRLLRNLIRGRGPGGSPPVGLFLLAYQVIVNISNFDK